MPCEICNAPPDIRRALENTLAENDLHPEYRLLEQKTGYSKSALHRHHRRCMPRRILAEHRLRRKLWHGGPLRRVLVRWPQADGTFRYTTAANPADPDSSEIREAEPRELVGSDLAIVVSYDTKKPPAQPAVPQENKPVSLGVPEKI